MIIGLSGYARSGKDEAAKVLVEEFGFKRVAFADKLRDFLYALNPVITMYPEEWDRSKYLDPTHYTTTRLRDVIDKYTWDGYKETVYVTEVRSLLQRLGTEAGRDVLWDSIWIDAALHDVDQFDNIVITDCRFPNEAGAVRERGGKIWRIMRAGVGPANDHPSETSLDDYNFDKYIHNDGTLEQFRDSVKRRYLEG